jgi:hypothetical protein
MSSPNPICPYCGNTEATPIRIRAHQIGYRCKSLECDRRFTFVLTHAGWEYHDRTMKAVEAYRAKQPDRSWIPDRTRDLGEVLDSRGIGRGVNAAELS